MSKQIKVEDVVDVYSGKNGCRCGCGGKYYYNSAWVKEGKAERGYDIAEDEINDRMVNKVVKYLNEHIAEAEVIDGYIFDIQVNEYRWYTAYLRKGAAVEAEHPSRVMLAEEA